MLTHESFLKYNYILIRRTKPSFLKLAEVSTERQNHSPQLLTHSLSIIICRMRYLIIPNKKAGGFSVCHR